MKLLCVTFGIVVLALFNLVESPNSQLVLTQDEKHGFISGGLEWSPDSSLLAIGSSNGIWLYSVPELYEVDYLAYESEIRSMDWSPDGKLIAGTSGLFLQIWDVSRGKIIKTFSWQDHRCCIPSVVAWSPDGSLLATGGWQSEAISSSLQIWNLETPHPLHILSTETSYWIKDVAWSPDGTQIIAVGDNEIALWDVVNYKLIKILEYGHPYTAVSWHPDEPFVLIGEGTSGLVKLWNIATGGLLAEFEGDAVRVQSVVWHPDGRYFASTGSSKRVGGNELARVWDSQAETMIAEFKGGSLTGELPSTNVIAWSPDGRYLASTSSDDGKIYLWDGNTYELLGIYQKHDPLY